MNKTEVVHQTQLAFDFLQRLYHESSYLIKEIEGQLAEEEEKFVIGKPGGYQITTRTSEGLDSTNVTRWPLRKFSVFFVPEEFTKQTGGVTNTSFVKGLKVIFIRVIFDEKEIAEPYIIAGVLYNIVGKHKIWPKKFEHMIRHIEYNENKVFSDENLLDFEDTRMKFKGKFCLINLFDINSSDDIEKLILAPVLKLFRAI